MPGQAQSGQRPNTLGYDAATLDAILDEVESGDTSQPVLRRGFVRWPFRRETIEVRVLDRGEPGPPLRVACRNLSRGGMCLLHSAFVHPGTRVEVLLPRERGAALPVTGAVVRCQHRRQMLHEVGVRFDRALDVSGIARLDPLAERFSIERVEPGLLAGTVAHVCASRTEHALVRRFLEGTRITLRHAVSLPEGIVLLEAGCDLVLADAELPDGDGLDLYAAARARGLAVPVVVATAETGSGLGALRARLSPDDGVVLVKPLAADGLLRALAEFLMPGRHAVVSERTPARDAAIEGLLPVFLAELRAHARAIREALAADAPRRCRHACLRIRGTAPVLGFAGLGRLAAQSVDALDAPGAHSASVPLLLALASAAEGASAGTRPGSGHGAGTGD
jgi:CheY-like chemotaxis protein